MDGRDNNVVLTGVPRGGTTLTCHLLNKLPDTVALHESIPPARFDGLGKEELLESAEAFYARMRTMIQRRGVAISKLIREPVTDYDFAPDIENELKRRKASGKNRLSRKEKKVRVDKELSPGYMLAIKSPGMFSALLPVLTERFPAYAIVRNPLAVLASWNSYDRGPRAGRQPSAERYDKDLEHTLTSIEDRTDRQLHLLSWYFERFERHLPEGSILRYEEIAASGGGALSAVTPPARSLAEPLEHRNANPVYARDDTRRLAERLLASEGAYWHFYSRQSVEALLREL